MDELLLVHKLMKSVKLSNEKEEDGGKNIEYLLSCIKKHNLQPYFKKIMDKEIPQLEKQIQEITNHYNASISFLKELQQSLEQPVVVVKGFSNHHITNGRVLLRGASDIDLLSYDPIALRDALLAQGFDEKKTETRHELSELQRNNILIDLHKFVPVISYPADINNISRENKMTTGKGILFAGEISYSDLVQNSIKLFENVLIPDVNMSLIILCTSMFRDYITSGDEVPHFKLINLVEVYLLLQEPNFNATKFLELTKKYHANRSVEFVNTLLQEIYQVSIVDTKTNLRWFPKVLSWGFNKWFIPNDLIKTVFDTSFENALSTLGAAPIQLKSDNILHLDVFGNLDSASHAHYIARNNNQKQVILKVEWTNDLLVQVIINDVENIHEKDIINFNFENMYKKITLFGCEDRQKSFGVQNSYGSLVYNEKCKTLVAEFIIPNNELSDYLLENNKLGMNIFIEKHERENEMNCYIPMIILRNEANS